MHLQVMVMTLAYLHQPQLLRALVQSLESEQMPHQVRMRNRV